MAFRKKQNHNSRHYKGKNPNSKSNRFKSKLVAKENLAKIRRKVYDEAKEQGMTDMQALVKSFEISPRD